MTFIQRKEIKKMINIFGIISAVLAYLIGSINNAILICGAKGIDVKKVGSGNAGATNTVRALGKKYGVIVFILDFLKGVISCAVAKLIAGENFVAIAGIFAILGHIFPLYHGFKGGKGVSTTYGTLVMINFWAGLIVGLLHIILIKTTKIVSISTIISFVILPFAMLIFNPGNYYLNVIFTAIISIIVIAAHKDNIIRLIKGEENSFKKEN